MQTLKLVTEEEKQPTLHAGRADSPELGVQGMQQLFDAHPNLNTTRMNENVGIQNANNATVQAHLDSKANPHEVTKAQVGLEKADNTSDMEKPVSTAQATAIALKADKTYTDTQDAATLTGAKAYADTLAFGAGAVMSVFGRAGAVTAQAGDYTAAQVGADPTGTAQSAVAAHATQPLHTTALTHAKAATVHTLTGLTASTGVVQASFTATADYRTGDTFTVGAAAYTAKLQGEDGALTDKYFVTGDLVSVLIDVGGKRLGFKAGGGAALNFRVIGSTTPPPAPKENDIWVTTDTPISSWSIAPTEPTIKTEGMAWIYAAQDGINWINANQKNEIKLYPVTCRQWIGSTWVQKTLKLYIGGAWKEQSSPILENNSWAVISAAVEIGNAANIWSIGDTKDITLTTGEVLTLQIYDFNHDDLADGSGKAGITFGMKNLMADTRQMNSGDTNVGGFTGSALYTWLQGALYNSLPEDLRAAIQSVNKKTSAGNNSSTINTNAMKLFLFSAVEYFGTVGGEGAQYPIFTDDTSRIKKKSNGAGPASYWWGRSPRAATNSSFCMVNPSGGDNGNKASGSFCICFGFCI